MNRDAPRGTAGEDQDAALLRRLALVRERNDGALREETILAELLGRHSQNIRRIAAYSAHSLQPSAADLDDIVNAVFSRLAVALQRKLDFGKPFRYVVADNTEWEVTDFARRCKRREPEVYLAPEDFPDPAAPESPTLTEEATALYARILELGDRDQKFLSERMLLGLAPETIAERHGVRRGVVDTATSRALKVLLGSDAVEDVRKLRRPSEGEV